MIKLDNINNILNLVGKMLRNKKSSRTWYVETIFVSRYINTFDPTRYCLRDNNNFIILKGTEEEIYKQLLNYEVI